MKRSIGLWQLMGFAVTSLLGTILHFLYVWTGEFVLAAPFSGINESTWEHMKLLFWPMLSYALVQRCFFRDEATFWCVKLRGILFGLLLIPALFYTYNGVIGKSPDWINIAIFFVAVAASFTLENSLFRKGSLKCRHSKLAVSLLWSIAGLFILFTFYTPEIGIFRDPLTGSYGI